MRLARAAQHEVDPDVERYLVVRQVRSQIGQKPKTKARMVGIGLHGKIGVARVHKAVPSVIGVVTKVAHLVHVDEYLDAGSAQSAATHPGVTMTAKPYMVMNQPGMTVHGPSGQFAMGETYGDYYSIRWSSPWSASEALVEFRRLVPVGERVLVTIKTKDKPQTFDGVDAALKFIQSHSVIAVLLDFSLGTYFWQFGRRTRYRHPEVGILSPELGRAPFESLAARSGTPAIASGAAALATKFAFLWR